MFCGYVRTYFIYEQELFVIYVADGIRYDYIIKKEIYI